jgi:methylated-DNA-[protein]-cysteine S-methyltransferase
MAQLFDFSIMESTLKYANYFNTPVGLLKIEATRQGIARLDFVESQSQTSSANEHCIRCKQQLQEYFDGKRQAFDLPLDHQGTDFQRSIWIQLMLIPFGKTVSYQDIASTINNSKAVRAVGAANGKNPVPIIVPCHRVIGSKGALTSYAGGLERKAWLLRHEARLHANAR